MIPTRVIFFRDALPVIALTTALALCPAQLRAHAVVVQSIPQDNARLTHPPVQVVLRFNAKIEKGLTSITLTTSGNRSIPLPPRLGKRVKDDAPDRIEIPLPQLIPGSYVLRYRVLATDGHATPGILRFTISGEPQKP
jgi:copper transport protein